MSVFYNKLWKLLIDKKMNIIDLRVAIGITTTALTNSGNDENVNAEALVKICKAIDCDINDVIEIEKLK